MVHVLGWSSHCARGDGPGGVDRGCFRSRLRGWFYVQFELDGGAQSVQKRGTQSLTRCRKTWWTDHWFFGSFLDPAPRSVTRNVAALICNMDWTPDCWDDRFIACLALEYPRSRCMHTNQGAHAINSLRAN